MFPTLEGPSSDQDTTNDGKKAELQVRRYRRLNRNMLSRGLVAVCCFLGLSAAVAVGTEGVGKYRPQNGEREPAAVEDFVRIVPPPTGGPLRVSVKTDKDRYHVYDPIKLTFGVNRDSFVYIFTTDAAGKTRQIFPNYYDTDNFMRAGKAYYIPDRGYDLEVLGPQGRETISIVAVMEKFPFLEDFYMYSSQDPYPASREGAVALVREIESHRREPSATTKQPIRPALKENLWATNDASFYVMGNEKTEPSVYKVARRGSLDIDTYPSNARIYIDSDYYGRSPQVINRLDIGYHRVLLMKEGYIPYQVTVYIEGNQTKQMDVFLQQTPVLPAQEAHDGQMRGGSINWAAGFGAVGALVGAGQEQPCPTPGACPPGTAPVQQAPAPQPQQGVYRDFDKLEK